MKMQKSRGATKTSSRVAAFVAFVAAAVLLEGRGAHAASSGICKTPTNFKPDVTFDTGASGFGIQTCQSTVLYWQGVYGQVFDASWSCEGKPTNVKMTIYGIASYGCCDGSETISDVAVRYLESACSLDDVLAAAATSPGPSLERFFGLLSASLVAFVLV